MSTKLRAFNIPSPKDTPESTLLHLLAELDSTPDDAAALQLALTTTIKAIPCEHAFLYEWSECPSNTPLRHSSSTDPSLLNEYLARFRSIDPLASHAVQLRSMDESRSVALDDVTAVDTLRRTPFHTRFLARHGDLIHGVCRYFALDEQRRVALRLFRRSDQAPFSMGERARLDMFFNHIAIHLRNRCARTQALRERDAMRVGMNLFSLPVYLLNADASVIAYNDAAAVLINKAQRLTLANDRLVPGQREDHASWIPSAMSRLFSPDAGSATVQSHLQELPSPQARPPSHYGLLVRSDSNRGDAAVAAVLILIDTCQPAPRHSSEELHRVFGFTNAEARVADALLSGLGTEEISAAFEVRRDTVRSHIKRLLAKTNTRGHADLQKLLLRLAPNVLPLQPRGPSNDQMRQTPGNRA